MQRRNSESVIDNDDNNPGRNGKKERHYSGSVSPSEVCSTSTDEGIYQEVDEDSNEEGVSVDSKEAKLSNQAKTSPKLESSIVELNKSLSALKGESSLVSSAPPPPPPPPPPPNFMCSLPKFAVSEKASDCDNKTIDTHSSERTRFRKNSIAKKSSVGPSQPLFIPPQFTSPPKNDSNIKPSEYLKRVANKTMSAFPVPKYGYSCKESNYMPNQKIQRSVSENHLFLSSSINKYELINGGNGIANNDNDSIRSEKSYHENLSVADDSDNCKSSTLTSDSSKVERNKSNLVDDGTLSATTKMAFSNATYCVTKEQLQGVLLKTSDNNNKTEITLTTKKNDLIEELKMAKNLEGIKKVKELHRNNIEAIKLHCDGDNTVF